MKKIIFISLISLCILFIVLFLFLYSCPGNTKLILNEIKASFKSTVYLNYQPNIDDIEEVKIFGAITLYNTDKENQIYIDKFKIQRIIEYLNSIPLTEATQAELPNKSPDVSIAINNVKGTKIGNIWIYGQVFIEDKINRKLFRIKNDSDWVIEGIEKIDREFK